MSALETVTFIGSYEVFCLDEMCSLLWLFANYELFISTDSSISLLSIFRLLKTKVEVEKEKKVIDDLKRDLAIIGNVSAIRKERENLERERTEVLCKKKKFEGGLDQLERNQEQEGKDSCKYANAELNFQKKKLELEATERVIKDLEDCYKVLNKELTSFHEMKMTEINTIIKDYWIAIYKGQGETVAPATLLLSFIYS